MTSPRSRNSRNKEHTKIHVLQLYARLPGNKVGPQSFCQGKALAFAGVEVYMPGVLLAFNQHVFNVAANCVYLCALLQYAPGLDGYRPGFNSSSGLAICFKFSGGYALGLFLELTHRGVAGVLYNL